MENQSRSERFDRIFEEMCASGEITPEYKENWFRKEAELVAFIFNDLSNKRPDLFAQILEKIPPEKRLAGLTLEERLVGLTEGERQVLLDTLLAKRSKAKTRKTASKRPKQGLALG